MQFVRLSITPTHENVRQAMDGCVLAVCSEATHQAVMNLFPGKRDPRMMFGRPFLAVEGLEEYGTGILCFYPAPARPAGLAVKLGIETGIETMKETS